MAGDHGAVGDQGLPGHSGGHRRRRRHPLRRAAEGVGAHPAHTGAERGDGGSRGDPRTIHRLPELQRRADGGVDVGDRQRGPGLRRGHGRRRIHQLGVPADRVGAHPAGGATDLGQDLGTRRHTGTGEELTDGDRGGAADTGHRQDGPRLTDRVTDAPNERGDLAVVDASGVPGGGLGVKVRCADGLTDGDRPAGHIRDRQGVTRAGRAHRGRRRDPLRLTAEGEHQLSRRHHRRVDRLQRPAERVGPRTPGDTGGLSGNGRARDDAGAGDDLADRQRGQRVAHAGDRQRGAGAARGAVADHPGERTRGADVRGDRGSGSDTVGQQHRAVRRTALADFGQTGELGPAADRAVDDQHRPRLGGLDHGAGHHRLRDAHRVGAHPAQHIARGGSGHQLTVTPVGELPGDRRPVGHLPPGQVLAHRQRSTAGGDIEHRQSGPGITGGAAADTAQQRRALTTGDTAGECRRGYPAVDGAGETRRRRTLLRGLRGAHRIRAGQQIPRVRVARPVEAVGRVHRRPVGDDADTSPRRHRRRPDQRDPQNPHAAVFAARKSARQHQRLHRHAFRDLIGVAVHIGRLVDRVAQLIDPGTAVDDHLAGHRPRRRGRGPIAESLRPRRAGAVGEVHRDRLIGLCAVGARPDQLHMGVVTGRHVDRLPVGLDHIPRALLAADLAVGRRDLAHQERRSRPGHHDLLRRRIPPQDDVPTRGAHVVQIEGVVVVTAAVEALMVGHLPRRGGDTKSVQRAVRDVLAQRHRDRRRHRQPQQRHIGLNGQGHTLQGLALRHRMGIPVHIGRRRVGAPRGRVAVALGGDDRLIGEIPRIGPVTERLLPDLAGPVGVVQPDRHLLLSAVGRRPRQIQHIHRLIHTPVAGVELGIDHRLRQLQRLAGEPGHIRLIGLRPPSPVGGQAGHPTQSEAHPVPTQRRRLRTRDLIPRIGVAPPVEAAVGERRSVGDRAHAQTLGRQHRGAVGSQPQLPTGDLTVGGAAGAQHIGVTDREIGSAAVGLQPGERSLGPRGRHTLGGVPRIGPRGVGNHRRTPQRGRRLPAQRRRLPVDVADDRRRRAITAGNPRHGRHERRPTELAVLNEDPLRRPRRQARLRIHRHRRDERIHLPEGLNPRDRPELERSTGRVQKTLRRRPHLRDERRRILGLVFIRPPVRVDDGVVRALIEIHARHHVGVFDQTPDSPENGEQRAQFEVAQGVEARHVGLAHRAVRSPATHVDRPVRAKSQTLRTARVRHQRLVGTQPVGGNLQRLADREESKPVRALAPVIGLIGIRVVRHLLDVTAALLPQLRDFRPHQRAAGSTDFSAAAEPGPRTVADLTQQRCRAHRHQDRILARNRDQTHRTPAHILAVPTPGIGA